MRHSLKLFTQKIQALIRSSYKEIKEDKKEKTFQNQKDRNPSTQKKNIEKEIMKIGINQRSKDTSLKISK